MTHRLITLDLETQQANPEENVNKPQQDLFTVQFHAISRSMLDADIITHVRGDRYRHTSCDSPLGNKF